MATYHCSVKIGAKGTGAKHAQYIARVGQYAKSETHEKLEHCEHLNMPQWAVNPMIFWESADARERANGAVYREIELALPNELNAAQSLALLREFIRQEVGPNHPCTFAIHNGQAAIDYTQKNRNAHVMYSERTLDGIERGPDQFFMRANKKNPEKGGCVKSNLSASYTDRASALVALRERWSIMQNRHLTACGYAGTVTHLSLKAQGSERQPEPHFGPNRVRLNDVDDIYDILSKRANEGALERARVHDASELESARAEVNKIDITGDLSAALADRARQSSLSSLATLAAGASRFAQAHEQRTKERQVQAERERVLKEHQQVEARANDIRTQRQSEAAKAEAVAKAAAKSLLQRCAQHSAECSLNKFKMNQEMTYGDFEVEAILHKATKIEDKRDLENWFNKQSLSDNPIDVVLGLAGRAANINRNSEFHTDLIKMLNDTGIQGATPERIALEASKSAEEAALKNRKRNYDHDNDNDMGM